MLRISNGFAIAGLVSLALGMTGVVFVVTDIIFKGGDHGDRHGRDSRAVRVVWFVLPLVRQAS